MPPVDVPLPDPTDPDADPDLPLPLPLPRAEEGEIHAAGEELIARAREGGAEAIRYAVPWIRVERERGSYDFTIEDETYDLALEAGLEPVIVLLTSPCWAHPSISCDNGFRAVRPDAPFRDDFARFARATIERYPEAAAFEVWNESNFRPFWGARTNPRSYVKLLAAVSDATAGLAGPPLLFNGLIPKPRWYKYLRRAYERLGAGEYADGTASHPYGRTKGAQVVRKKIKKTKRVLRRSKAPRRVWITEIGWSTNRDAEGAVSPERQARRIAQLERIAAETRARSMIVHRLRDIEHADPWEAGLGAVASDDAPKPLFCDLGLRHGVAGTPAGC